MSLYIRNRSRRYAAAASIGTTTTLLGAHLALLEIKASLIGYSNNWLRTNASMIQSYWTDVTFRAVRACANIRVAPDVEAYDDWKRYRPWPFLIISNHQGAIDIPAIAWFMRGWRHRDIRWIVKREIRRWPFIGRSCEKAGCAFVSRDRAKARHDLKTVLASARTAYEEHASFVIFPEGTRFKEPVPDSGYKHVLPPNPLIVSQLIKLMPDYPVCSLTLCQHPRGVPSSKQTLYIRAGIAKADAIRKDVRAWLKHEWDAKEAFIASLSEAPPP